MLSTFMIIFTDSKPFDFFELLEIEVFIQKLTLEKCIIS